jgi:hypothetical protein
MSKLFRIKCSCGEVSNTAAGGICPKCGKQIEIPTDGMIFLYRMGSPLGIANGFGIYINNEPIGYIGNKETICVPVKYGKYNIHVACGMNRKCRDLVIEITPENNRAFAKVWMKPGFWTNSFVVEPSTESEMPNV